jgi:hypothetical protein
VRERERESSWLPDFRLFFAAAVGIIGAELSGISEPRDNMDGAIKTVAVPPNYLCNLGVCAQVEQSQIIIGQHQRFVQLFNLPAVENMQKPTFVQTN